MRARKYKDTQPSAIYLFKEMHCSKKRFSETIQKAIDDMVATVATPDEDGQFVMSSAQFVSHVLPSSS
uniref:Uncharacterized protein n=1 Tax=Zea mays TaxID=4577 RepID=B6SQ17_MAIZE|nr:hypothetical protein [Zea mays]